MCELSVQNGKRHTGSCLSCGPSCSACEPVQIWVYHKWRQNYFFYCKCMILYCFRLVFSGLLNTQNGGISRDKSCGRRSRCRSTSLTEGPITRNSASCSVFIIWNISWKMNKKLDNNEVTIFPLSWPLGCWHSHPVLFLLRSTSWMIVKGREREPHLVTHFLSSHFLSDYDTAEWITTNWSYGISLLEVGGDGGRLRFP